MTIKSPSLFSNCVLWYSGEDKLVSGSYLNVGCPILPSGVTETYNGTFGRTDLGNNRVVRVFDGSTNNLSLTDSTSWDIWAGDFTIVGWIRIPNTSSNKEIFKQTDGTNWVSLYFASGAGGGLYLQGRVSSADNFNYVFSTSPTADVWFHFAYVKSGSNAAIGYKNAELVSVTTNQAWRNTTEIAGAMVIGNSTFAGNIKDLTIYKGRALTTAEIKQLMILTDPVNGEGLLPGLTSAGQVYDYIKVTA